MFGSFFWIFLATQIEIFNLGDGFKYGVAWIIVSQVFSGQFNSLDTILRAIHGGDALDSLIRLVAQAVGGFLGCWLLSYFGFDLSAAKGGAVAIEFNIMNWVMLFLAFVVYYFAKTQFEAETNDQLPGWVCNILLFGLTFAVAGDDFLLAPNRVFYVGCDDIVAVLSSFWFVYIQYTVCAFLAAYVLHVLPSVAGLEFKKDNFVLPKYERLALQN